MNDTELKNEYRKEADTWKRLYKESQVGLGTLDAQLETARRDGWNDCLESVRSSIRNYPNQGGDIVIMQAIDAIINAQLETARKYINMSVERPHLAAYYAKQAQKALAQIGTHTKESKPIICIDCDTNEAMPGHYRCLECKAERKDPK